MKKIIYLSIVICLLFFSCERHEVKDHNSEKKDSVIVADPVSNYQHLVAAIAWYSRSGEMRACYYQAFNLAKMQLDSKLAKMPKNKKKAVVADIDETLLNNIPFEIKCVETGRGYSKEIWEQWTSLSKALALPGALEFCNYAKKKGVEVFYITNRRINELAVTKKNLDSLKFPYADDAHLICRTDENSKEKRRNTVAKDYEILLLIGDNLADFSDVFEKRDTDFGFSAVDQNKEKFGEKFIILPNPMYGDWEMAIYGKNKKFTDAEKGKYLKEELKSGY
ncbi:MAG: 5'-nucleotidase, lipoprotein e(P4) family [Bacteroidia bacterium]|nr:5'-nucleotidase, lipoprotein e(P4) family [Bacteroidia bacterium]